MLCLFLRFLSRISIHALLAESDRHRAAPTRPGWAFLSTLSLRRATTQGRANAARMGISIHALLAESDHPRARCALGHPIFLSTLSLRRATGCLLTMDTPNIFLSTLSLRRATIAAGVIRWQHGAFLSTLSLRRATFAALYDILKLFPISIHALLAESDTSISIASNF